MGAVEGSVSLETEKVLQQKAYPSASAFEQVANPETGSHESAFGAQANLPAAVAQQPGTGLQGQFPAEETIAFGAFPAVALEDVRDPVLRSKLAVEAVPSGQGGESAFGSGNLSAALPSAFVPQVEEPEEHPLTGAIPVLSPAPTTSVSTGVQQGAYPSVSAPTTAIPTVAPKRGGRWMPTSLKSFVKADQSLTAPIRGMGRLAQKQFAFTPNRAKLVQEKEHARDVLNFTLRLSETMFHYGADALDVDSAIVAVCSVYGLDDVEVDITNQSVIINYVSDGDGQRARSESEERFSHTVVRVVRSNSENYASLSDIYGLIHRITHEDLPRAEAEKQLTAINTQKKPYSPLVIFLANIVAAGTLTYGIGGSVQAAIVSAVVYIGVFLVGLGMTRLQMPSFFSMAAGAGMITFAAISLSDDASFLNNIGRPVSAPHIVAAGLIMLLPTSRLVSAVQDAINGFPLTAAGKFVSTGMSFLGLVVGIATAVTVLSYTGATPLDISQTRFDPAPVWANLVFMTIASLAIAITMHARIASLGWITLITVSGICSYHIFNAVFGIGTGRGNTAIAALVVSVLSTLLAYTKHAPQAIYVIPALTFLLPGLSIFRGMYTMTVEADSILGLNGMITAASIIVAMAAGVALGTYLMQYLIQRYFLKTEDPQTQAFDR